jgi:uncharacterized protein
MKKLIRYITSQVAHDLNRKMVFVGGPRQVGKTTLAKSFLMDAKGYLNWDLPEHREAILKYHLPVSPLWVFDEIHKYRLWRNFLKGLYDTKPENQKIMVTGSAKLDYYRYSGDSLQGRYYYLRLHPLSLAELKSDKQSDLDQLLHLGGFPEPFFSGSQTEAKRWTRDYRTRLIREDLVQLERVYDLGKIEQLSLLLPDLVGSPLSINAVREDLQTSHKSVAAWIDIFERLYSVFRLSPFQAKKTRAVKKEQKHYHMDWSLVSDLSKRFENLIACALLKWVHYRQDTQAENIELRYYRDIDKREVDFIIVQNEKITHAIECKWNDDDISPALKYLKSKYKEAEAWQISMIGKKDFLSKEGIRVSPAVNFLVSLV